jgi:hypothetical protein
MLNFILLAIVILFFAWELSVFFLVKIKTFSWRDPHTFSRIIWKLENRFGWPVRLIVGVAMAVLFSHLVFQWP